MPTMMLTASHNPSRGAIAAAWSFAALSLSLNVGLIIIQLLICQLR
jgi:hypothetical protein